MLHSHLHVHAGYIMTQWKTDARRTSLTNMYLSLYCKGSKRVTQGLRVRGSWRPNRNCNILTPNSYGFLYCILSASSMDLNSSGPKAPSAWYGFPYHISSIASSPTVTSVLTELYNSSTLTRSLKSHVKSSSSGNNCHAVQRSLSSGASVNESIMGFLARPIASDNFRPRDFLS